MERRTIRVRVPLRFFGRIASPPCVEAADLTDPATNDFIANPDAPDIAPPEFAATGEHRPDNPLADPRQNDWIPQVS